MFQGIFKSAINDANKNYIFGTGSIPINIKTAQLATFADGTTKQQGYQVAEVNKLISTMLTGWSANGNKPKSMSNNYLELILSCDNGFVVKKRLQFPHIIAWKDDSTPYNIADVYKEFSIDNWLKADDFENPDITLVVEPTDEILTTSTATPPEATTTNSGRFYLYYRNLPIGVNRVHIEFHIKTKTEPIDFDLEIADGMSWKDAQTILASNEQAKINVLLSTVKDVYKFTGAEGNFENITMHEWSALYQQIISLAPSNKFTHDLYFYIYDESELNTKITELDRKAIKLKFMGTFGILDNGEYGYRTDTKKIRYKDNNLVVDVPFYPGAIYTYNNELYVYKGDTLVSVTAELQTEVAILQNDFAILQNEVSPLLLLEIGGIKTYTPGDNLPNNTRVRTVYYIKPPFSIDVKDGFLTRVINKYTKSGKTYTYSDTILARVNHYEVLNDDGYYYRIAFQKVDDTQTISESEVNEIVTSFKNKRQFEDEHLLNEASVRLGSVYMSNLNLAKYSTYSSIISDYDALVLAKPNFVTKIKLGETAIGTGIYEYVFTSGSFNQEGQRGIRDEVIAKKKILLMTGVHGYEPGSVMATLSFIREYVGGNSALSKLRNLELHIIPCVNPDGYNAGTRGNSNGVDINRNFNENWQFEGEGTTYFSGPSPASENETQIVQSWIDDNTDALFVIDFHQSSFNNEIACLGYTKLYSLENELSFKKRFLVSMRNISNMLIKERGISYDSIFGYTYDEPITMHGLSNGYIAKKGLCGGCLEVPENISASGVNSIRTIAVASDIIGNLLVGWYDLYK